MSKGPIIAGIVAVGAVLLLFLRRSKAAEPPSGVLPFEDCLAKQAPRWMTADQAIQFCELYGTERIAFRNAAREAYCEKRWRDDPNTCQEYTDEYQEWVAGLRPAPGTTTTEVSPETIDRLRDQWADRLAAESEAAAELHQDVMGVLSEVDELVRQIQANGIPDRDARRARLQISGLVIDMRPYLERAIDDGVTRWQTANLLTRTESIKDWLSLRRETQRDNYSLVELYDQVVRCVGFFGGAAQCASERNRIEARSMQYPRFEAFFSAWRINPSLLKVSIVPSAPALFVASK